MHRVESDEELNKGNDPTVHKASKTRTYGQEIGTVFRIKDASVRKSRQVIVVGVSCGPLAIIVQHHEAGGILQMVVVQVVVVAIFRIAIVGIHPVCHRRRRRCRCLLLLLLSHPRGGRGDSPRHHHVLGAYVVTALSPLRDEPMERTKKRCAKRLSKNHVKK
jgi:hypothetical protein